MKDLLTIAFLACGSVAILALSAALMLTLSKPPTPKRPEWFKCLSCGVFEYEHSDGEKAWSGLNGRYRVRECRDCKAAAVKLAEVAK